MTTRAGTLKVLAGALVILLLAAAFPVGEMILDAARRAQDADPAGPQAREDRPIGPLPFDPLPPANDPAAPDATPGDLLAAADGLFSSLPGPASSVSTGSALLDQVIGSARLMGHAVELPVLPVDRLEGANPLRAAILEWIAVTGSPVDPHELAAELSKADALPLPLQRDLALLVLSASKASLLQAEALARLTPEQIAWIHAHPEVAADLARGVDNEDTRRMAALAALVDTPRSIQAALLLLQAVEATRGSLAQAQAGLAEPTAALDPQTRALLTLLSQARGRVDDAGKVRYAAELVALATGVPVPPPLPAVSFREALAALVAATGQVPDPEALPIVLERADALPADLQAALAGTLLAQARAVEAAHPASALPRAQALLQVLVAAADALPVLQKHGIYWREAPDALRVGQWTPTHRAGWIAEHAALFASAGASPSDLARAGALLHGLDLPEAQVPARTFVEAFAELLREAGREPDAQALRDVEAAGARLDPAVRDAAALLMSGAAESARLHRLAFADLSPDEKQFLLVEAVGLDARADLSPEELSRLARASALAARVDDARLAQASLVAALATEEARRILEGRDAYAVAGDARPAPTLWERLLRLLPFGSARAQAPTDGAQAPCADPDAQLFLVIVQADCGNDVLLRILYTPFPQHVLGSGDCTGRTCNFGWEENTELLVVTGPASSTLRPQQATRVLCDGTGPGACKSSTVHAYGAPLVHLDLGGADTYQRPVAMTSVNQTARVSLHLDLSGADAYLDPSPLYDARSPFVRLVGQAWGHPTQGSALFGGVAILLDAAGDDTYAAPTRSQGFGRYGMGLVADLSGADQWRGGALVQGASGDGFNLGLGILLDATGDDARSAATGQGYGLGGVMLDLQGRDTYANGKDARGVPGSKLDVVPGGNLTSLSQRRNEAAWTDGPGDLNLGIGLDQEATLVNSGDRDGDGWSDFLEAVAGSDAGSSAEGAPDGPNSRARKLAADADGDVYPDFVERALSTDPKDARSYPAGFPRGPTFHEPTGVYGELTPTELAETGLAGDGDKVLDLRLPLQDAGRLDAPCTGGMALNVTDAGPELAGVPIVLARPGTREEPVNYTTPSLGGTSNLADPPDRLGSSAPIPPAVEGSMRGDRCLFLSYETSAPGEGNASQPFVGEAAERRAFRFKLPAGILAVGDVVATRYTVDYFYVVDLGGNDLFNNSAGGALPVETRSNHYSGPEGAGSALNNTAQAAGQPGPGNYDHAFLAPSLVLNVDPNGWGSVASNPGRTSGNDVYAAPPARPDFAHGSLWGVLVDTAGDDSYTAGSGSQGSMGGVLLDLAGSDRYVAANLSQGASLSSSPRRDTPSLPQGGANPGRDAPARRAVPGMLLDMGDESSQVDFFFAGSNSQGFARGHFEESMPCTAERCAGMSPEAFGILLDVEGRSQYDTRPARGTHAQGVGGPLGVGILADLGGTDVYYALGAFSHGATASQALRNGGALPAHAQPPGAGILLDGGATQDAYVASNVVRPGRDNNVTLSRGPATQGQGALATHADVGLHVDGRLDDPSFLDALAGNGDTGRKAVSADGLKGFLVHLPTARFAIGSDGPTTYAGTEYAFAVDLGGVNRFEYGAAGLVPAALGSARPRGGGLAGDEHPTLHLYPVSFLFDAGDDASRYEGPRAFSQGAGFFSVGVLVDAGGHDTFAVHPERLPSLNQSWMPSAPSIDGTINDAEWNVTRRDLVLHGLNDSRLTTSLTLRIANDADNLYVALQGSTQTPPGDERRSDRLVLALDRGASRLTSVPVPGNAQGAVQTHLDEVVVGPGVSGCETQDRHWNGTEDLLDLVKPTPGTRAACVFSESGDFSIEIQKPLREAFPKDLGDLNLPYDATAGWTLYDRLGLHLEFVEAATGVVYAWPPNSTLRDGEAGFRLDGNLSDEMSAWAVTALAQLGNASDAPPLVTRDPSFSQGAGLAGVGVLAMLGAHNSNARLVASDHAQGYGGFGGLGVLLDAGGSDVYEADEMAQAAGQTQGFGLFVDAEGNERYLSARRSLGHADGSANALFLDLYGFDHYGRRPVPLSLNGATPAELSANPPPGNERAWTQGGGAGIDATLTGPARKAIAGLVQSSQMGAERTTLTVTRVVDGQCTTTPVEQFTTNVPQPKPIVNGEVCLRARVRLDQGQNGATLVSGGEPVLSVESVDFLLDGTRHASGAFVSSTTNDARNPGMDSVWEARLNGSHLPDGPRKVAALAVFRVEQGERGSVLFYDDIDPENVENAAVKSIYVNNPPALRLSTGPAFLGAADSAFSPLASAPAQPHLRVDYAVSRDAGEDRLEISQGWKVPPRLSNLPCASGASRLCNVLPLYFTRTSEKMDATPRGSPADRQTHMETSRGLTPFIQESEVLRTPLEVMKKGSFRVSLPDHATTLPVSADYKTHIVLRLRDANGNDYKVNGQPVILHDAVHVNHRDPPVVQTAYGVFGGLREITRPAAQAMDTTGASLQRNPLAILVDAALGSCAGSGSGLLCEQLAGDPGAADTQFTRPCRPDNVLASLRDAYASTLCSPTLRDNLQAAARDHENPLVTDAADDAGTLLRTQSKTFDPVAASNVNWTDYWFDVGTNLLPDNGESVVIPAGATLFLEIRSLTELFDDTGGAITHAYVDVVQAYLDAAATAKRTSPVPLSRDLFGVTVDPLGQVGDVLVAGKGDMADREKRVSSLTVVPFSFFTYLNGGEDQARLEILTPAEATTRVDARVETPAGDPVIDLASGRDLQGDLQGSPTRDGAFLLEGGVLRWRPQSGERFTQHNVTFDGRRPDGSEIPDGLYVVRLTATDFSGRANNTTSTFLLDRTPPQSFVTTRSFAGAAYVESNAIPVTWRVVETGSGVQRVAVYGRAGGDPDSSSFRDPASWRLLGIFPASVTATSFTLDSRHDTYYFATVAEDVVGNVERAIRQADPFHAGLSAKLASGEGALGYLRVVVDQSRPVLGLAEEPISGARILDHRGAVTPFVRAGTPIVFRACAADDRGVREVRLVLDQVNVSTNEVLSRNFTATAAGECDDGGTLYEYAGWGELNLDKDAFPDGVWAVSFEAFDLASNRVQMGLGAVVLDGKAPTLALQEPVYPPGQVAAKFGDVLSLRVIATDEHGVDEAAIELDVRSLNRTGKLMARPVRVDGILQHEATFRVDAAVDNAVYPVQVLVPDLAGNVEAAQFHVLVDFKKFHIEEGSLRVTNVTHASAILRWNTTENTTGQVKFGTGPLELTRRSAVSANLTREHAVLVEGLQPATRYFLRAVSANAAGQANESATLEIVTGSALVIEPLSPAAGAALSGPVPVRFQGGLRGVDDFVTYTVEVQARPDAPWSFLTTLTRKGGEHEVLFNTSRWLDGEGYRVRVAAEAGRDRASATFGPFLLDNTPPRATILAPLLATNDTTPRVLADLRDDFSGLAAQPAQLFIDGVAVPGPLEYRPLAAGALRLAYDVPSALEPGVHVFELRVRDKANATLVETWKVSIDGDAPDVAVNPPRFAPGTSAAKAGGTVTLNLTVVDASGVSSVTADARGLSPAGEVRLARVAGTPYYTATLPVSATEESSVRRVAVTAIDLAGNVRLAGVDVPVDNLAPELGEVRLGERRHTRVELTLTPASEPVLLVGTATAPRSPPVTLATTEPALAPSLAFEGLLPSRSYAYTLHAQDGAGNVAEIAGVFRTLDDTVPPGPARELQAEDLLNGTLRLSWTPARDDVGVAFHRIYRSADGATFLPVAEVEGAEFHDADLPLETPFHYQVSAVDHGGNEGPASGRVRAIATVPPRLIGAVASPAIGTPSTLFRYEVTYVSPGGKAPESVRVVIDGVPQTMLRVDGASDYAAGVSYFHETRLAPHKRDAPHTYAFEASDGRYVARFPEDGSALRGPLVSGDLAADEGPGGFAAFAQRVPLAGAAGTAFALLLALAVVALVVRRKKEGPK